MATKIKAVVQTGNPASNQVVDLVVGQGAKSQAASLKAVKGARYALLDATGKEVPAEQVRTKRVGKHLHVALDGSDEADLVVENYFEVNPVAEGGAAAFGYVQAADVAAAEAAAEDFELAAVPVAAAGISPLGVVGGLLAAAAGGAGGAAGASVGAGAAVAPLVAVKATYVGTGTVGNVVKLYDGNTVLASTTVEVNGTWRITSEAEVANPNALSVAETSAAGEGAKMAAADFAFDAAVLDGSAAPKVVIITDADNNGYVNAAELKIGGGKYIAQVSFDASKVTVGDKVVVSDGVTTRTVVLTQPDLKTGFVSVAFSAPREGGTLTVTAVLKDSTNSNASLEGSDSALLDTIAPNGGAAPVVEIITDANNDGVVNTAELAGKQSFTVKASFDNTEVFVGDKVVFSNGSVTQTVVLKDSDIANGYVTTQFVKPKTEGGTLTVSAYVKDMAGQVSASSKDSAKLDTTAPSTTVKIDGISDDTGVAGDFITSDSNGLTVQATLSAALANGQKLWYSNDNGVTWANITADVVGKAVTHVDAKLTSTNIVKMRVGSATDNFGATAVQLITIETGAPNAGAAPTVEITTDANNDGVVSVAELKGASTFSIKGSFDKNKVKLGDKLIFNDGTDHVVALTATDIANGFVTTTLAKPADGATLSVTGKLQSITGVNSAVSASDSAKLVLVDNSKATVSITTIDDVANDSKDTGVSNADFITSDSTLIIKGTVTGFDGSAGAAGDKVRVQVLDSKNAVVAEVTVLPDASGNWSFDNKAKALADGKYSIKAVIVDANGKTVNTLVSQDLVVDSSGATEQPGNQIDPNTGASVSIVSISDDTGVSATDFITKDTALTYSGSVTGFTANGDLVKLELVDSTGKVIDSTHVVPSNGTWSWTRTAEHANGQYELRASIVDVAGNPVKDVVTDAQIIIIDSEGGKNTDPSKPITPSNPVGPVTDPNATAASVKIDSISEDTGSSATDFVTNDATLVVKGSVVSFDASTGDLVWVQIKDSANKVVAAQYVKPDASGAWTLNNTANILADGKYTISADIVDVAGNPVKAGPTQALVVDTNKGGTDPAANPENGPTSPVDPNATGASISVTSISTDNGASASDFITADNTLVISGTISGFTTSGGAAGDKVRVQVVDAAGKVAAEKYMDPAATTWSFDNQSKALANGDYVIKAAIVDKAGNVVKAAVDKPLVVNANMISSTTVVNIFSVSNDTGLSSTDFITQDRTLIIKGNVDGGLLTGEKLKITVFNSNNVAVAVGTSTTLLADNSWTADVSSISLSDGVYTIKAEITAADGSPVLIGRSRIDTNGMVEFLNTTAAQAVVIDNSGINNPGNNPVTDPNASAVMAITSIHDEANGSVDSGASSTDFITNDNTLIIKGTISGYSATGGGAGDKVRVQIEDAVTKALVSEQYVTADASGNWSMDNRAKALVDGKYTVKASIVDLAGNPVNTVATHDLVIDTNKGGTDPVVNPANNPTTDPNATGTSIAITGISQDTGLSATDYITSDSTLVINGSVTGFSSTGGATGDQVRVQIVSSLGVVVAEKYFLPTSTAWSFDNQAKSLADGNYTIKAAIVDAAGNPVKSAADQALVINGGGNNNPNAYASVDITGISDDTGASASDFITSDTTLTYRGTVTGFTANGDVVKLQLIDSATNAVVDTALVTPVGDTWSWARTTAHTAGQYQLRATITDATGKTTTGAVADVQTVVVDTAGPAPVVQPQDDPLNPPAGKTSLVINSVTADDVINAAESAGTVAITGTVRGDFAQGDVVTLTVNGNAVTGQVAADGTFSINVSGADLAADGDKTLQASLVAHDKAGNPGTITASHTYGVSTVGPNGGVAPTLEITTDANNDGLVSTAELKGGNTFVATVSFTSSKVAVGDQVVLDDGTSLKTITLTQNDVTNGFVIASYAKPAEGGSLTLTATMVNAAGTPSASSTDTAKLDTTGPAPVVPPQDDPLNPPAGKTSLVLDSVTADNTVNATEGAGTVAITGTVRGEFVAGDVVSLKVNGKTTTGTVAANGSFSINVSGADLLADGDKTIDASLAAHDKAGNPGTITATQSYAVGTNAPNGGTAPVVEITTDANNDGFVNSTELAGKTTFAVKASFDSTKVEAGTQMVFSDGTTSKTITLSQNDVDLGFVNTVFTKPAEGNSLSVTAKLQDSFNNTSAAGTDKAKLDTSGPAPVVEPQDDPLNPPAGKTSLVLDSVTADNTINAAESLGNVAITGKVRGEFVVGDVVSLKVNGKTITGTAAADGSFSISVSGADLAADGDKTIEASVVAHDKANNSGTISTTKTYTTNTAVTNGGLAPKVEIITDANNDGWVGTTELNGGKAFAIKVSFDAAKVVVGDQVVLDDGTTVKTITLSQNDLDNGFVLSSYPKPAEGASLNVSAKLQNSAGNPTASGSDSAKLDTTAPTPVVVPQDDPLNPPTGKTSLTLDAVTTDNTLSVSEATGTVAITGKVRGEFTTGDTVTLAINGKNNLGQVSADGSFSINVSGADLKADADHTIDASLVAHDKANNAGTITAAKTYTVINNQAPVNNLPSTLSATEDTAVAITGLQVTDAATDELTVSLSVTHGAITVATATGVAVLNNGTGSVQIVGSTSAVNALLASSNAVMYKASANYNGSDTLTMSTSDGSLSDTDNASITVQSANDAPVPKNVALNTDPWGTASVGGVLTDLNLTGNGTFNFGANTATVTGNTGTNTRSISEPAGSMTGLALGQENRDETVTIVFAKSVSTVVVSWGAIQYATEGLKFWINGQAVKITASMVSDYAGTLSFSADGYTFQGLSGGTDHQGNITFSGFGEINEFKIMNDYRSGTDIGCVVKVAVQTNVYTASKTIEQIYGSAFTDVDGDSFKGVVITSAGSAADMTSKGSYQYSTNNGTTWNSLAADLNDSTSVFLDKSTLVRFAPTSGNSTTLKQDLLARLVDDSGVGGSASLVTGNTVNVSGLLHGGTTAYSDDVVSVLTSNDSVSVAENTSTSTAVYDMNATLNGGAVDAGLTYSLLGTDAAQFNINSATGAVTFKSSPNYEAPTDSGANNIYNITVRATATGTTSYVDKSVQVNVTDVVESLAGQAEIDLGAYGKLIKPVQVEGKWYYYWDLSGDGTANANVTLAGSYNGGADWVKHDFLDDIFKYDINGNLNPNAGTNTNETYRYASINGVKVALPTYGSTVGSNGLANDLAYQAGTAAMQPGTTDYAVYDDLLAIWDAYNGTGTGTQTSGAPSGWFASDNYWSATQSSSGHVSVIFSQGYVADQNDAASPERVIVQVLPVVLDLNRDGILSYGQVTMDVNGDRVLDTTKWAGAQDGVLVWDKYADGLVHDNSQYAFAQYDTDASNGATDLSGLADAFDSNHDGKFNAADAKFAEFKVWQDANQNGVSEAGEVRTLADWGIQEINLISDGVVRTPSAGVTEAGRTTANATDGSEVLVSDAGFEYSSLAYNVDGSKLSLLGANMDLDLSSFVAQHGAIAEVNLAGSGANTLKLSLSDVLGSANAAQASSGMHQLLLTGDANDTAVFSANEWTSAGQVVADNGHSYAVYSAANGAAAQLLIDQQMLLSHAG